MAVISGLLIAHWLLSCAKVHQVPPKTESIPSHKEKFKRNKLTRFVTWKDKCLVIQVEIEEYFFKGSKCEAENMGRGGGAEENRPDKGPRWWRQVDLIDDWSSSQSRGPKNFYKEK